MALTAVPKVHAFSDPRRFSAPSAEGGGGGRQFTGAPGDGLSCAVCHGGDAPPAVTFEGLPEVFVPGREYEVRMQWADLDRAHAVQLQMVQPDGASTPLELVTEGGVLADEMHCHGASSEAPAAYSVDVDGRRILGVEGCFARGLRFRFVAPDVPQLDLGAGVVRSDGSGTFAGDGALEVRLRLARFGDPSPPSCTASVGRARPTGWLLAGLALVLRGRQRKRTPARAVRSRA